MDAKVDEKPTEAVGKAADTPRIKEVVITLNTPVQAWGEMIKELKFRRPTGGDIMQLGEGYPIVINWQEGRVTPHSKHMTEMMAILAGVPTPTIQALDAEDWSTCAHRLMGFFTPGEQAMRS